MVKKTFIHTSRINVIIITIDMYVVDIMAQYVKQL